MTAKVKASLIVLACFLLIGTGYGLALYRRQGLIAGYDKRDEARQVEIAKKEAEQNQLRGQNDGLRQENAKLTALQKAIDANIQEHGGSILAEQKKLEQIDEKLKTDEQVIKAPADKCVRCRRFSEVAVAQKLIDRPLTCKDECDGR